MSLIEKYLNDITAKDENKAIAAASHMINNSDVEMFKLLVGKVDFLFDFIKNNLRKRIETVVNNKNYKNLLSFFDYYSPEFDDLFASLLAKYADENLTDEIFEFLENGSLAQKTYAAKYFSYIPDTVAVDALTKNLSSDWESLSYNCAQALGKMHDSKSYDNALKELESDDDFDKLRAVKFFAAYAQNHPLEKIFEALMSSSMPENIAGEIPYIVSLVSLINTDYRKYVLITIDNILSGLGEILPLSQVFQFELFELLNELIEINKTPNHYQSKISQILLKALAKIKMLCSNDEYIFDEDKNTKQELQEILALLEKQPQDFWIEQKQSVLKELEHCNHRILAALDVVKEYKITSAFSAVKKLLENENEIIVCEAVSTLRELNKLSELDKDSILNNLKDVNIKAIIENYWSTSGA